MPVPSTTSKVSSTGHAHPPPLISIPDSATSVSCPSSASSSETSSYCSTSRLASHEIRAKRRRTNRLGSSSSSLPTRPPPPNCLQLPLPPISAISPQYVPIQAGPDLLVSQAYLPSNRGRLNLHRARLHAPPKPPSLPVIDSDSLTTDTRLSLVYPCMPFIHPSSSFPETDVANQISTCIQSDTHSFSVSISSEPSSNFAKPSSKFPRLRRPNLSRNTNTATYQGLSSGSSTPLPMMKPEEMENLRQRLRNAEQSKWWHWAKTCRTTGDGNKSAYYSPLRCDDLEINSTSDIVMKPATVCHLDGEITHPIDQSKWRVKVGL